jgi:outer membrane protein insertion porin family
MCFGSSGRISPRTSFIAIHNRGITSITESDILDAFKDKKVDLSVGSQFDMTEVERTAGVIKELLAAHGHPFATVKATYEKIPAANAVKLVLNIDEGPKAQSSKNRS